MISAFTRLQDISFEFTDWRSLRFFEVPVVFFHQSFCVSRSRFDSRHSGSIVTQNSIFEGQGISVIVTDSQASPGSTLFISYPDSTIKKRISVSKSGVKKIIDFFREI